MAIQHTVISHHIYFTICYRHLSARDTNCSTRSHNNSSGCTCTYAGLWSYPILFCSYTDIKMLITKERNECTYGLLCLLVMIRHTAVSDMSQHDYCLSRTKGTVPPNPKGYTQSKQATQNITQLPNQRRANQREKNQTLLTPTKIYIHKSHRLRAISRTPPLHLDSTLA